MAVTQLLTITKPHSKHPLSSLYPNSRHWFTGVGKRCSECGHYRARDTTLHLLCTSASTRDTTLHLPLCTSASTRDTTLHLLCTSASTRHYTTLAVYLCLYQRHYTALAVVSRPLPRQRTACRSQVQASADFRPISPLPAAGGSESSGMQARQWH